MKDISQKNSMINKYDPNTISDEYKDLKSKYNLSKEMVRRLEADNKSLCAMYKNEAKIRDYSESEKEIQNLYKRLLLEACPDTIFVLNKELKFLIGTEMAIRSLGYERAYEIENMEFCTMLDRNYTFDTIEKLCNYCNECLNKEKTVFYDDRLQFKDGKEEYVHIRITPAYDSLRELKGLVIVLHDITELTLNKKMAENALKVKSNFMANISHEIRTPMNAIKGMGSLLNMTGVDEVQKEYISNILGATDALLKIINDVLDFSKMDSNDFEINERPYKFSSFIEDIVNEVGIKARDKNIEFIAEIDTFIPSEVIGDSVRIKQAMMNILDNAVKFTNGGFIKLGVKCNYLSDKNIELIFNILDTGVGIKGEEIDKIFKAFSQLDMSKNRSVHGTGLGLAISKNLIDLMEGTLEFESEYLMGSLFTVRLPQKSNSDTVIATVENIDKKRVMIFSKGENAKNCVEMLKGLFVEFTVSETEEELLSNFEKFIYTHIIYWGDEFGEEIERNANRLSNLRVIEIKNIKEVKDPEKVTVKNSNNNKTILTEPILINSLASAISSTASSAFENYKYYSEGLGEFKVIETVEVLLVDDNEINLTVGKEMLSKYDIIPDLAESGLEAFEKAKDKKYDLILMDHMMPKMSGFEATLKIREEATLNRMTPIIAFTADSVTGDEETLSIMDDFIGKPIEIKELNRVLRKWIPGSKISECNTNTDNTLMGRDSQLLKKLTEECGLDGHYAVKNIGGKVEVYLLILNTFMKTLNQKLNKMTINIEHNEIDSFRIEIHSMKSALYNIGAKELSELARKLEIASKDNNLDFVKEGYIEFLNSVTILSQRIGEVIGDRFIKQKNVYPNGRGNVNLYFEHCKMIIQCIEMLETDDGLIILDELCNTDFEEETNNKFTTIRDCIDSFDYDNATELLVSVIGNPSEVTL